MYGDVIPNVNYFTLINRLSINQQLEVWSWVLGIGAEIGRDITSPFRSDNKPNCSLREWQGRILFTDFGDRSKNSFTCIHAIAYQENVGLNKAASMIDAALLYKTPLNATNLKIKTGNKKDGRTKTKDLYFIPYTLNGKPVFTKEASDYWKKRYTKKHELTGCYNVSHFYLDGNLVIPKQPCFALMCGSRFKIYQPYNPKQKWLGNTNRNDVWVFDQLSSTCVITSSYKDCLPWYRYTNHTVHAFQSESMVPDNTDYTQYDYIVINYDTDQAGILNAYKLLDTLQYKYAKLFFFPKEFGKDGDEVLVNIGESAFKKLIQNI